MMSHWTVERLVQRRLKLMSEREEYSVNHDLFVTDNTDCDIENINSALLENLLVLPKIYCF